MSKSKRVPGISLAAGVSRVPIKEKAVRKYVSNSQKGFTLIDLLAVLAIIGILASIVVVSTGGNKAASQTASNQQTASAVNSAASNFSSDQTESETLATAKVTVTATINSDTVAESTQSASSIQPEKFITADPDATSTAVYFNEFPTSGADTDGVVVNVVLTDLDGVEITRAEFLEGYTAIDIGSLAEFGFLEERPDSFDSLTSNDRFHNFMWTFKKSTSAGGTDDDTRTVRVFKLFSVSELGESVALGGTLPGITVIELTYEQIF